MTKYIKIGDFSRLGMVTVKTLHHYDEIGLLKPAHVDSYTGYRYYTTAQLRRIEAIRSLKDLDLSLDEIKAILESDLSTDQWHDLLKEKEADLQTVIKGRQAQLRRVQDRLERIERIRHMTETLAVTIKEIPAQKVIAWRGIISKPADIGPVFDDINRVLSEQTIRLAARDWLALYHHDSYRDIDLDVEFALPVEDDFEGTLNIGKGRVMTPRTLEGVTVACTRIHLRTQQDIVDGNRALADWIDTSDYDYVDGVACREAYGEPALPDGSIVFETQFPVKKA